MFREMSQDIFSFINVTLSEHHLRLRCERKLIPHSTFRWKAGDIVGSLLDLNNKKLTFFHNGLAISPISDFFEYNESGFFAAASFMSFQQCRYETIQNSLYPQCRLGHNINCSETFL